MEILNTKQNRTDNLKVLVYALSGAGKTRLISTCKKPIIISSEKKLVSISGKQFPKYPLLVVDKPRDFKKAIKIVKKNQSDYNWVCVDSISDIAEKMVISFTKQGLSKRDIYGQLAEDMTEYLNELTSLRNINIYCIAKSRRLITADGEERFYPSMPGRVLPNNLPYLFDEVFCLRTQEIDSDDEEKGFKIKRYLQTGLSEDYEAKDSSGLLKFKEKPDLTKILAKIKRG